MPMVDVGHTTAATYHMEGQTGRQAGGRVRQAVTVAPRLQSRETEEQQ